MLKKKCGCELRCSGMVDSSCSTSETHCVNLVTKMLTNWRFTPTKLTSQIQHKNLIMYAINNYFILHIHLLCLVDWIVLLVFNTTSDNISVILVISFVGVVEYLTCWLFLLISTYQTSQRIQDPCPHYFRNLWSGIYMYFIVFIWSIIFSACSQRCLVITCTRSNL